MGLSNIPTATDCTRKWKTQLSFQASDREENEWRATVEIETLQNNNICGERAEKEELPAAEEKLVGRVPRD
ncbi:hypothetical protein CEXT_494611 [Caerostris extrusa]|uniref:Uncharacterized protein n=1 Tax=Caerostris extrusa TaxID=172846 RepID=A0AAV4WZC5_CAEEX|nr:hypothetical protein CEXT_494611 [Caerostris extrusa]